MHLELKDELFSPDIKDLQAYRPDDPLCFAIEVETLVGSSGQEGADLISFTVCTPLWLQHNPSPNEFLFGLHYLIVWRYDYDLIKNATQKLLRAMSGENWKAIAPALAKYVAWEGDPGPYL